MVNLLVLIVPLVFTVVIGDLEVLYEWKYIDYQWSSAEDRQSAIDSGNYTSSNVFTIDFDRARDGRVFVTTPRQAGVPATLSIVTNKEGEGGRLLRPYPNWAWNTLGNCDHIVSVYRVAIDGCNRLWVLDTGNNGQEQICPAQLLAFNLETNRLVKRVKIPSNVAQNENSKGLLITPVVETHGFACEHTRVYMADSDGYGLVVYNEGELKRFSDQSFNADTNHSNFTIEGKSFQLQDGLFSLALQPRTRESRSERLFYRPLSSLKQYFVSTKNLLENFRDSVTPNYKTIDYTFPTQVSIQTFSPNGVLFMGYTNPPAIACWNSYKPMNDENVVIVAEDHETLQFTSSLKIKGHRLFAFTNRFQKIMAGTQNFEEVNFRILMERNIHDLIQDTNCQ